MRRAVAVLSSGERTGGETTTVTLAYADRHRRRIRLVDDAGEYLLLDLPRAMLLTDGDRLRLDDGGSVRVRAAAEKVFDVTPRDPQHGMRLAWHVGNRHVPLQILANGELRILCDHVLGAMLEGLGARLNERRAPFEPEPGAYAHGNRPEHGRHG